MKQYTSYKLELNDSESLSENDLSQIFGGGIIYDIFQIINESWTDMKKGFSDGFNGR